MECKHNYQIYPSTPNYLVCGKCSDYKKRITTRDELIKILQSHRAEIVEADEWRPLAKHILDLVKEGLL